MSFDPDSTFLLIVAGIALMAALFVFVLSVKLLRMKISKEWGFLKARLKYKPAPPKKIYVIKQ